MPRYACLVGGREAGNGSAQVAAVQGRRINEGAFNGPITIVFRFVDRGAMNAR